MQSQLKNLSFHGDLEELKDLIIGSLIRDQITIGQNLFWRNLVSLNCSRNRIKKIDSSIWFLFLFFLLFLFFFFFPL